MIGADPRGRRSSLPLAVHLEPARGDLRSAGLLGSGWAKARILWLWTAIALVSGLASLAGFALFENASPDVVAFVLAFAAGAILTMLADIDDAGGLRERRQARRGLVTIARVRRRRAMMR